MLKKKKNITPEYPVQQQAETNLNQSYMSMLAAMQVGLIGNIVKSLKQNTKSISNELQ